jgi:DNA polymerase-3 subunit delta'
LPEVDGIIGNQRAKDTLRQMLARRRLPGTLMFAGPSGVGKRLFAVELARAFNCHTPQGAWGCGACAVCRRIGNFVLPAADDKDGHKKIAWGEHADVGMILPFNRNILVAAARNLDTEAHFRPYEGTARVFLIEAADKLSEESANALLKTLEEPPPTTFIVLLTARPAALLPTIRSRCQVIRFAPLTTPEIENHLLEKGRASAMDAALLARLAEGSLGRALSLNISEYREQRSAMFEVLKALTIQPDRVRLLRAAEELNDAKYKERYESSLTVLAGLARDVWLLSLGTLEKGICNIDLLPQLKPISVLTPSRRTARWLSEIAGHLQLLNVNINRKVAADALLLDLARS